MGHVEKPKNKRGNGQGRNVFLVIGGVCTSVCLYVRVCVYGCTGERERGEEDGGGGGERGERLTLFTSRQYSHLASAHTHINTHYPLHVCPRHEQASQLLLAHASLLKLTRTGSDACSLTGRWRSYCNAKPVCRTTSPSSCSPRPPSRTTSRSFSNRSRPAPKSGTAAGILYYYYYY